MESRELKDFLALVRDGFNVIPLHETLQLDRETPVSLYERFNDGRAIFLLESAALGEDTGRYSFIGLDRTWRVRAQNGSTIVDGANALSEDGPLETIRALLGRYRTYLPEDLPDFFGARSASSPTTTCVASSDCPRRRLRTCGPTWTSRSRARR